MLRSRPVSKARATGAATTADKAADKAANNAAATAGPKVGPAGVHKAIASPAVKPPRKPAAAGAAQAPQPAVRYYEPGRYRPEQSVGYLMRRVLNSVVARADEQLAEHDLTYVQWLPLYKLAVKESDTMAGLARDLAIDPGAMTRALHRLEAKGLLLRQRSLTDRRVVHLVLTAEGRRVARRVPPVLADVLNVHLQGFTEAEWLQLVSLLGRMLANGDALRAGARA